MFRISFQVSSHSRADISQRHQKRVAPRRTDPLMTPVTGPQPREADCPGWPAAACGRGWTPWRRSASGWRHPGPTWGKVWRPDPVLCPWRSCSGGKWWNDVTLMKFYYLHISLLADESPPVGLCAVSHGDPVPHLHHVTLPGLELGWVPGDPVPDWHHIGVTALLTKAGLEKEPEN